MSVLDLSCELISDEPECHLVALFLPRSLIEDRLLNLGGLHGSAPTGPYAMLLAEYLDMLARRLPSCTLGTRRLRQEPHAKCLLPAWLRHLPMSKRCAPVLNWCCSVARSAISMKATMAWTDFTGGNMRDRRNDMQVILRTASGP